jgi:drug/metabolite transporter (DMT)-like permease
MAYISALIMVQLTMKQVLNSFPYPLFMSTLHFIFSFSAVLLCMHVTGEKHPESQFEEPKFQKWWLRSIVPACVCQYLAIAMNNVSLMYIGAGINALISLATPVVTAIVSACFGLKIVSLAWVAILLTIVGDAVVTLEGFKVTTAEGQSASLFLYGVILSVVAMGTRGAKTVLQDKLMNNYGDDEDQKKLSPLQSWFFQGPVLIALGLTGTVIKEGLAPWQALPATLASPLLFPIIGNISAAVCLNISVMYAIKMLGAPAAQIAGKLNVLVVAALSCALLGETLTLRQGASTLLIIAGAGLFEKAQSKKLNDLHSLLKGFQGEAYAATQK